MLRRHNHPPHPATGQAPASALSATHDWDIYLTSEVAAWLDNLQATDARPPT
jgi:hypothetical protein